ncbi:hypothetical protein ABFS83_07G108700 [Erythranthe nasuta]
MIIAFWNIRGLNKPLKQDGVKNLIQNNKIDICGILESKLKTQDKIDNMVNNKFLGWKEVNNLNSHQGGRILILWNPATVTLIAQSEGKQVLNCWIRHNATNLLFHASFVFGLYKKEDRQDLWNCLEAYGNGLKSPWIILGDFNCVLNPSEKIGGRDYNAYYLKDFNECCQALNLADLNSHGCKFTWYNNCPTTPIWSKLDRAMGNLEWFTSIPLSTAAYLPSGFLSDHSPCIITIGNQENPGQKMFKYFNMWSQHPDFQTIVKNTWENQVYGTEQFKLCRKLKMLKQPLKALNLKAFSHISSRVTQATADLEEAQNNLQRNLGDEHLAENVAQLSKRAQFLANAERSFYTQKAKCNYIKMADRCNKFFHGVVKKRNKQNHIATVEKSDGSFTTSYTFMIREFLDFYKELLGTEVNCQPLDTQIARDGPTVSREQADLLIAEITDEDVLAALKSIGDDKAPGPDGYNAQFFKKSWTIVGDSVCKAVK